MNRRRTRLGIVIAAVLLVVIAASVWLYADPYRVVQLDFTRQRLVAGLSTATVQVDDHRWTYVRADADTPDAPLIVMVHGFTGTKENWYPLARALRGRYALVIPDLPGWGDSQRIADADYGYVAQSQRLARFIESLQMREGRPVVLVGHSMGGGIAVLTAARHPALVSHLGLLASGGVRFKDNRFGREVFAGRNPFAVDSPRTLVRYTDTVFHDARAKPWIPWPADRIYIARRTRDAAFEQRVLDRIGRSPEGFAPGVEAARVDQPALLLWCRQDAVIDASAIDLFGDAMPQALRVLLDGCGHMSMMEQPDAVAQAVVTLIERGVPR